MWKITNINLKGDKMFLIQATSGQKTTTKRVNEGLKCSEKSKIEH